MRLDTVKNIAANGWRSAFRSRLIYLSAGILGIAMLGALLISWQNAKTLNQERQRYQDMVRTNWVEQPDRHPHRSSHYGYLAFRPKSALSFFDSGVDSFAGTSIFLEPHKQNTVNFSEVRHSNGLLRFGELNLAMILQMIVPLLIFFLGFSAISGEREDGVLQIVLSQGVSWRELIAGKTIGILAIIFAILSPLILVALALWLALNQFSVTLDSLFRIVLLTITYGAFFVVCASLAVVVSAFARSSRASLLILVAVWIFFWVAMPRGLQNLGAILHPAPTKSQFDKMLETDLAKEGDSHNPSDPKFKQLKEETLAKYNVKDVKELPFNYSGFVMTKAEEISSGIFRKHYGELIETFGRQNQATELASVLNPYLAIRHISMSVSGTDFRAYEDFQWQAEEFRFNMVQKLNDLHTNEIKAENDRAQKVSRENWDQFPTFEYKEKSLAESIGRQSFAVFSLFVWFAAALFGIYFLSKKTLI